MRTKTQKQKQNQTTYVMYKQQADALLTYPIRLPVKGEG